MSKATPLRRVLQATCLLALVLAALSVPAAASARAEAAPCWKKLINDWYDGRIDHSYEVHCYRDALKHLPQDVRTYSDAYDVINRALASATRGKEHVNPDAIIPPPSGGGGPGGTTGTSKTTGTGTNKTGDGGGTAGGGFLTTATDKLGSDSADTVPIPLLVLGGLALLLVAAGGAGLVARRIQARRGRP